ncbi:uncharacterized protein LOC113377985 isoform X2 [Ctenocephalides felis]|uniref:uncharacterized protein LOC113377985 isoform X2 n=1 Tax=Ctenocephalides felis TaxID=7515 RepID=UPI000E6E5350|nr:uncharacterized protein LOC113377985 isoform X2 [Ctenocephalides felis]
MLSAAGLICVETANRSSSDMQLCKQVSIEMPAFSSQECVSCTSVPVPEVPPHGARILVAYAGACYRLPDSAPCNADDECTERAPRSPANYGLRDGALFAGYEVSGIIEALGSKVDKNSDFSCGDRVIIFPYNGIPHGYAEYVAVPELNYLIRVPQSLPLSVAAMLPTGALLARNAVFTAHDCVQQLRASKAPGDRCRILIVGTGGLALWALRIASHHFKHVPYRDQVVISVASLRDDELYLAQSHGANVVQWKENLYESQIIERTLDACGGKVDIVIDFCPNLRSLQRHFNYLAPGGIVLISEETTDRLMPKFDADMPEEMCRRVHSIGEGTLEQLEDLLHLVATKQIEPPPHTVFSSDEAGEVIRKLCHSEIPGRAILRFHDVE